MDGATIAQASGLNCSRVHTSLCMDQIESAAHVIADGDVIIACRQEQQRFMDLAVELDAPEPGFVDIRDRAGWNDGQGDAAPKMAALVAEAALDLPVSKSVDVISEGVCLILGASGAVFQAAQKLADTLAVTVLLTDEVDVPQERNFDVVRGNLKRVTGALGGFELRIDSLSEPIRGGRGDTRWTAPKNGAKSVCDIILDLSGGLPMFPAPEKREGYLRADPTHEPAVSAAIIAALQLVGTFEKPLYVKFEAPLCAHSRAEQIGCTRCLDLCPTGAITSAGDHVAIDPMICAGCGACSAACPSGAISYDAPPLESIMRRLTTLARTYREAGGGAPRLLVHDDWGRELISLAARHGDGLPPDVIPVEVAALPGFGHAEILGALGVGFSDISIMVGPKAERDPIMAQIELARALSKGTSIQMVDNTDPIAFVEELRNGDAGIVAQDPILPLGSRRQITRLVAKTMNTDTDCLPLPAGAPYGAVLVDTDACTLCLSCVSLCPSGALMDNEDMPQLRFQEDACLQCGLCANICPENAIALEPRLNLTDAALSQTVLNEEEPFSCIECGSLFGVKSTVERILQKLAGKHSMYQNQTAANMIQMCENCRIQAQFHSENSPFAGQEKPRPRTTDDYLSKRKDH